LSLFILKRELMMSSPESKRIRAGFSSDANAVEVPIEEERRAWEEAAAQAVLPEGTSVEPYEIEGVQCELVRAPDVSVENVMMWLHGGGYNAGSCVTHRDFAARLSAGVRMPVLVVEYRLAPEHPFPEGLADALSVYRWLLDNGYASQRVFVGGDSAGGGLLLSLLLMLKEEGVPMPAGAVFLSAWIDLALRGESMGSRMPFDPTVSEEGLRKAAALYIGERDPDDPLLAPLDGDLRELPPLLIHVGDDEILLSDSTRLAERARAVGVEVELEIWPEMWHFFHAWAADLPEAREAIGKIGAFVRKRWAAA
jgi:acetyl esterase/lipase